MSTFSTTKLTLGCLTLGALLFSFFLMFHTFSYDGGKHEIRIASKLWSDFGAHIPLIRSFSYGPNLTRLLHGQPVESPLFPGEPIRYHFGFYALVGVLEKLGIRIDWALNLPSALGFFLLLILIFRLSYVLFANNSVALLSVLFFLFNGSLSFLKFFQTHTIADVVTNTKFPSFGPWDGGGITAFWNLNIYTNQRHLALSYAIVLALLIIRQRPVLTAVLLSFLLFTNYAAFAIAGLWLAWVFWREHSERTPLAVAALLTLPALLWLQRVANLSSVIIWEPGYLARTTHVVLFWWQNLGAHMILIPLGLVFASRAIRSRFGLPLLALFILPNLFRFSPDMINNHKFFNFFLILGSMFSAYAVVRIGQMRLVGRIGQICLIFLLTLSGIIDFFPVINDYKGSIADVVASPDAQFFATQTKPADVVANSTWFYHPASLAGRSIYSGYTYFTWSYGYDQVMRETTLRAIYEAPTRQTLCHLLTQHSIALVELNQRPESYLAPNWKLWNDLSSAYENPDTNLKFYETKTICP